MEAHFDPAALQQQLDATQEANAELNQQFATLQQHNAALTQQMQQMQQYMMQHFANQQQAGHGPEHPITRAMLRTPPRQFEGRLADRREVDNWVFDMLTRFNAMHPAPADADRIAYAVQHMAGAAKTWYRTHQQVLLTWNDFETAFRREYEEHNKESHATHSLLNIKQKDSRGGRVAAYTDDFNRLVLELPGIPNNILRNIYIDGLNPSIRRLVKAQQGALDLAGAQAAADDMEDIERDEDTMLRALYRNSTVCPDLPRPRSNGSSRGPTPMDLGVMGMQRRTAYLQPRLVPQRTNRQMARFGAGSRNIMQAVIAGPYSSSSRDSGSSRSSGQARWDDRHQGTGPQRAAGRFSPQGNGQRRRQ